MEYVLNITKDSKEVSGASIEEIRSSLRSIYDEKGGICSLKSCMGYLGDNDFILAIYKITILVVMNGRIIERLRAGGLGDKDLPYRRKSVTKQYGDIVVKIRRLGSDLYKLRFVYKEHIYEAVYGYK